MSKRCLTCETGYAFSDDYCIKCQRKQKQDQKFKEIVERYNDKDMLIVELQETIIKGRTKLSQEKLREICDMVFKKFNDLDISNQVYMEIDHANNMVLDNEGVRLGYV